jgi:holliday junction DNA helicase RuvB
VRSIVARSAQVLGMDAPPEVVARIASRSRATPRVANALLKRVRDFAQVHSLPLSTEACDRACELFGIDSLGLTKDDRRYLETLRDSF